MRLRRRGLPDDWANIVEEHVAVWRVLDDGERELLEATSDWLLRHKHWEAARGFALVDEITVTIAAQAALLVLGTERGRLPQGRRDHRLPDDDAIAVYAGPVRGTVTDGVVPVLGEAHEGRGPVLLAWDQAEEAARQSRGAGTTSCSTSSRTSSTWSTTSSTARRRWSVAPISTGGSGGGHRGVEALRAGIIARLAPAVPYGAHQNPSEFFAVATEAFFDVPVALEHHEPNLYEVMRALLRAGSRGSVPGT